MPHRICPHCAEPGRLLQSVSKDAYVEYYRCDKCGHVWTHDKGNPDGPPSDVTFRKRSQSLRISEPIRTGPAVIVPPSVDRERLVLRTRRLSRATLAMLRRPYSRAVVQRLRDRIRDHRADCQDYRERTGLAP